MTERARLTDALALAARPREREYAIRDTALQGFLLHVQPNAARSRVFHFRRDGAPRRVTLGKPEMVKATMSYLNSAILPAPGHLRVGPVVRADIARFFHEYGRRKPGGANRSHDILRNMFDCAIAWGHRPEAAGNPCKGIVRYRRPPRGRLLGAADLARLGAVLRRREDDNPVCVAAVRLLLLTGCRPGEIRRLRWFEVKPDRLALIDSKTGPRHVLLGDSTPSQAVECVAVAVQRKLLRDGDADRRSRS